MRFTYQTGAQPLAGYTIHRGIHRGGFGEVYFGQSDGGKEVALKLLHHQDQETELRGVAQCLNLKHANLVNIFDVKTDSQGDHWVVMEYVSGSSLDDVLESFPSGLPLGEVRDWLSGLVAGVSYLHERGIVHRDLKPANVYRENGVVKVGDVGLSKRLDSDHRRQHTQSVGTVYYMAPEVANGKYGPEVDVYSLGVMLYEMITGRLPFTGETTAEILMKHLTAQPDLTPIPRALRPAVARALEKDPRKRTPTARQLEQEFLRASGVSAEPMVIPDSAFVPRIPTRTNGHLKHKSDPWISIRVNRPLPKSAPTTSKSPSGLDSKSKCDQHRFPKLAIAVIAILLFFGPRSVIPFGNFPHGAHLAVAPRISFLMTAIAIAIAVTYYKSWTTKRNDNGDSQPPRPVAMTTPQPIRSPVANRSSGETRVAPTPAITTWRESLPELGKSIGSAGLIASLLSAGVYCFFGVTQNTAVMPSMENVVLFIAVTVVGSWLLLIGRTLTQVSGWKKHQCWYARLATGVVIGTIAYGLGQFLLVDTPHAAFAGQSAFSHLGSRSLIEGGHDPTWLGYVVFFASWLGLRRWSRDMDPYRKRQFSIWLTAASIAMGYLVSVIFAFPQWNAMLWAGTISATVQLVSTWNGPRPSSRGR